MSTNISTQESKKQSKISIDCLINGYQDEIEHLASTVNQTPYQFILNRLIEEGFYTEIEEAIRRYSQEVIQAHVIENEYHKRGNR